MGTVVALFTNYRDADQAVESLTRHGFDLGTVGVLAPTTVVDVGDDVTNGPQVDVVESAGGGAVVGGLAGLLVGVAALVIPGVGPLFVVGAMASVVASMLAGAAAGAVTGGLLGAHAELGIPETEAAFYADGVKAGGVIMTVQTIREAEAMDLLRAAHATKVHESARVATA